MFGRRDYPLLSVVIPALNEDENIENCIESVLEAVKGLDYEIIMVDSGSTDRTVEIAKKYPIKILQLKETWTKSASAAKYIGNIFSGGEYIQFIDGDMTMDNDWFKKALPVLGKNKKLAGIVGLPSQEPYDNYLAKQFERNFNLDNKKIKEGEVERVEGAVLFRKDILDKCGSWNPYLVAEEERELCKRISNKGFKFYVAKIKYTHHLGLKNVGFVDIIKQINRYASGQGQILRYSLKNKSIRKYWISTFKSFLFISLFLFSLISGFIFNTSIVVYSLLFTMLLLYIIFLSVKKGGILKGLLHFGDQLLKYPFVLKGFLKKPKYPRTYPTDVKVIKWI